MVEAFQRSRGLPLTGEVDATTWSRLLEAGWRLGDRLLYQTRPYLRGDDVADLQVRLSQLGFDPGRVDGVFGPLLHAALSDFQRNCALPTSGTLTLRTLLELRRVSMGSSERVLVTEVRERANLDSPTTGPIIVWGPSPLSVHLAGVLDNGDFDPQRQAWSVDELASFANDRDALAVVTTIERPALDGLHLHYWSSYRSYSRRGEQLASALGSAVAHQDVPLRLEITGMALPVLRETRMTTVQIEHGVLSDEAFASLAAALAGALRDFFHSS